MFYCSFFSAKKSQYISNDVFTYAYIVPHRTGYDFDKIQIKWVDFFAVFLSCAFLGLSGHPNVELLRVEEQLIWEIELDTNMFLYLSTEMYRCSTSNPPPNSRQFSRKHAIVTRRISHLGKWWSHHDGRAFSSILSKSCIVLVSSIAFYCSFFSTKKSHIYYQWCVYLCIYRSPPDR